MSLIWSDKLSDEEHQILHRAFKNGVDLSRCPHVYRLAVRHANGASWLRKMYLRILYSNFVGDIRYVISFVKQLFNW